MKRLPTSILGALLLLRSSVHARAHFRRRIAGSRLALALLILIVSGLATAAPASAAVPGLVRVEAVSASNSSNKSVTAECPAGTVVIGTGGGINAGNGDVILTSLAPRYDNEAVVATSYETNSTSANWTVTANAMCAPELPGQIRVDETTVRDSSDKPMVAYCPLGKFVVGMGFDIYPPSGDVLAESMIPVANLSVSAWAREVNITSANWELTTTAICANVSVAPILVVSATTRSSDDMQTKTITCPSPTRTLSIGFNLPGSSGEVAIDDLLLSNDRRQATVKAYESDPYPDLWNIGLFLICAET
jgi:hypothetical protein